MVLIALVETKEILEIVTLVTSGIERKQQPKYLKNSFTYVYIVS